MNEDTPYWKNPRKIRFETHIDACSKGDNEFLVQLKDNVVRAEGGGQAGDKGIIKVGDSVVSFHNTISADGMTTLVTDTPVEEGDCLIIIDESWRLGMMRNHSGEHLFMSAMKKINPDYELGYIWISGEKGTIEVFGPVSELDLYTAEEMVQRWIIDERPVSTGFVAPDEVDASVRAREGMTEKHERIRIVKVEQIDESACSGIHVSNTGEIHAFKITDFSFEDKGVRVEFSTGDAALSILSNIYNQVLSRRRSFPLEMEQIGPVLDKAKRLSADVEMMVDKIHNLLDQGPKVENLNGIEFRHEYLPGLDVKHMREILMAMDFETSAAVLFFSPGEKSNLVFWIHSLEKDAADYIADVVEDLGGRGGGSKDVYNGGFTEVENPEELYDSLVHRLRKKLS